MTPARIDRDAVGRRLTLIDAALTDLASLGEIDEARLIREPITRAATERLLQVIVDLAFDINGHLVVQSGRPAPETGRRSFLDLAAIEVIPDSLAEGLAPSAGLRNVLVHHYVDVRVDIVARSVTLVRDLYPRYVRDVSRYLAGID